VLEPSSPARPDSVRVLNRVPMGSRGWPTQPSMLVMEVWPLWSNSEMRRSTKDTAINTSVEAVNHGFTTLHAELRVF